MKTIADLKKWLEEKDDKEIIKIWGNKDDDGEGFITTNSVEDDFNND